MTPADFRREMMPAKGWFIIPDKTDKPVIGARRAYIEAFRTNWACDDAYLRVLAAEFMRLHATWGDNVGNCRDFVLFMRENDVLTPPQ